MWNSESRFTPIYTNALTHTKGGNLGFAVLTKDTPGLYYLLSHSFPSMYEKQFEAKYLYKIL